MTARVSLARLRRLISGPGPIHQLLKLIDQQKVTLLGAYGVRNVLDVGANIGQYGRRLRAHGYGGRIISFEPLDSALPMLRAASASDPAWEIRAFGLGAAEGAATINVSANSCSSSLLVTTPRHVEAAPGARCVGREPVALHRLDAVLPGLALDEAPVHLKIDTQGYELQILEGAGAALGRICSIEVELSLVPLYQDGPSFEDVYGWLAARGFHLVFTGPAFIDPASGEWLQIDGIFHRHGA